MQALLKRFKKEEKGFTLIELLAVIVILAVIAVIAVPLIGNIISKTKTDSDIATARQVYDAARLYVTSELGGDFTSKTIYVVGTTTTAPASGAGTSSDTRGLQSMGYLEPQIFLPSSKAAITGGTVVFTAAGALQSVTLTTVTGGTPEAGVTSESTSTATTKFYTGDTVLKSGK
ncbi:type II secretion system protein [Paenibacillus sp. PL2-23]|uniref:type II secretion system protein n=1 Tax=Paenibacillus sp. PL2-23 TaxID=2100729 RepID=UPI0030F6D250